MRRCSLVLLCLSLVLASPALADVLFRGIGCTPLAGAAVDLDADGSLDISNIGSSGQDGVVLDCTNMDGACLALSGSVPQSSLGLSQTFSYSWTLVGQPAGSHAVISGRLLRTEDGWSCSADFSSVQGNPLYDVSLSSGNNVLYQGKLDASSAFVIVAKDQFGNAQNGAMFIRESPTLSRPGSSKRVAAGVAFSSPVTCTVGGVAVQCDRVEFSVDEDPSLQLAGSSCALTVAAPAGSPPLSVRCADGACRALDHWVQSPDASIRLRESPTLSSLSGRPKPAALVALSGGQAHLSELSLPSLAARSGGGGGGGGGLLVVPDGDDLDGDGLALDASFAAPSLLFDGTSSSGGSSVITIVGTFFSSTGVSSPASCSMSLGIGSQSSCSGACVALDVSCDHSSLGATMQWVTVLHQGVEVAHVAVAQGAVVQVVAPPGGPQGFAVATAGSYRGNCCRGHVIIMKAPNGAVRPGASAASSSSSASSLDQSCPMEVSFRCDRVFLVGGQSFTGDQCVISGDDQNGNYGGVFHVGSSGLSVSSPQGSPGVPPPSAVLLALGGSTADVVQPTVGAASITSSNTCASVPVDFLRADTTPVRGYSVTFHLSPELAACGAQAVEGDYLSSVSNTQFYLTDNGGGSYTADCAIMGPVCGATGDGRLFTLQLGAAAGVSSGTGQVVVDSVVVRDCSNLPVPAGAGATGYVPVQTTAPAAIQGLVATQVRSGNPAGATTGVSLAYTPTSDVTTLLRAGFGNYPFYDNAPNAGSAPQTPSSLTDAAASGRWSSVTCSSGQCSSGSCSSGACTSAFVLDATPSRDYLYYVAFSSDVFGNTSPPSNMTPGTLDYHLGDVSDGTNACTGDNQVSLADVSLLGAHYGASVSSSSSFACLDVGPTTDYSVGGRPTTDGKVGFEDLMMFAMNFSVVSAPQSAARPAAMAVDALDLQVPATLPAVGQTFDAVVSMDGAGDAQGVSVRLGFDPAVLEQVGVAGGALLDQQGRPSTVLSSGAGSVDAVLLGGGAGIAGRGELAHVTFRVKAMGEAKLAIAGVSARDAANKPVAFSGADAGAVADARTGLGLVFPNPFRSAVEIRMSLRRDQAATLAVYDVAGRRVHTLVSGLQPAGTRTVTWDGRDDTGTMLAPGAYLVRFDSGDRHETRTVRLVR